MRLTFAAAGTSLLILSMPHAQAHFTNPGLSVPNHVERAACRMVKESTRGVITTRRVCEATPAAKTDCPLVTRRIIKAGGEVVVKTRRQCS
jgi:hypothetical protein